MKEQHRVKIEQCLTCFEFEKVKKVMDCMDWCWVRSGISEDGEEPPTIYQLIRTAKELLESCSDYESDSDYPVRMATGGFSAERWGNEFRLAFEVDSWDTST